MFRLDSSSFFILSWILELQRKETDATSPGSKESSLRRKVTAIIFRGKSKKRPFPGKEDLAGLRFAALKRSWAISSLERRENFIVLILAIVGVFFILILRNENEKRSND
jgi:hypothetical protein